MRKLVFAINISLDGCSDHTKFNPDEETLEYFTHLTQNAGTFVYGRETYQLMVPYWPDIAKNRSGDRADNEFAQAFDSVNEIIVFSRSLDKVEQKNTRVVRDKLKDTILELKQEPGKDILTGGVSIPSQLMGLDLIDEYHFVVHPILVGEGRRLLNGLSLGELGQLKFVGSKILGSGCIVLRYVRP